MHDTASKIGQRFFDIYCQRPELDVIELGSNNVNGSLRDHARPGWRYVGLDVQPGPGVDRVLVPGQAWPVESACADVVVSSSVFEHDRFFWRTFLEMTRVLRLGGVAYLNVPSNGGVHRYPEDCWRFYPDAGHALAAWSTENGLPMFLLESFVADREGDVWNDFVAVFIRSTTAPPEATTECLSAIFGSRNVFHHTTGASAIQWETQDMELVRLGGADLRIKPRRELTASI